MIYIFLCLLFATSTNAQNSIQACIPAPKPGTAQWHYQKGAEELMGAKDTTNAYLANQHFQRAANMGYPPAIKALADSYYSGDGVDENKEKALFLYMRAADMGDGSAQFNVGVILLRGYANGVINNGLAFYYLSLATMNPDFDEMAQEVIIYRDEAALKLTPEEALEFYAKLAKEPCKTCAQG